MTPASRPRPTVRLSSFRIGLRASVHRRFGSHGALVYKMGVATEAAEGGTTPRSTISRPRSTHAECTSYLAGISTGSDRLGHSRPRYRARLVTAATWSACLWGGRFNPIVPIQYLALADQLVKTFAVDVLIPVEQTRVVRQEREAVDECGRRFRRAHSRPEAAGSQAVRARRNACGGPQS